MLTLYGPPRTRRRDGNSDMETFIPAGRPYLTKVNGRLVMARGKSDKTIKAIALAGTREVTKPREAAIDFLGEAFGIRSRVVHRRAQSPERPVLNPLMITGLPYTPQQYLTYSTPLSQHVFSMTPSFIQTPQIQQPIQQPAQYTAAQPQPTRVDFDQLRLIDAHYKSIIGDNAPKESSATVNNSRKDEGMSSKTTVAITEHICANCRGLRSKRYHAEHPIKPGDTPTPEFCGKCKRAASSTGSSSSSSSGGRGKHRSKNKKKVNRKKYHKKSSKSLSEDESSESQTPKAQEKVRPKKKKIEVEPVPEDDIIVEEEHSEERRPLHKNKNKKIKSYLEEDTIIVEEEHSEEESAPRGRTRLRLDESEISRRPLSPLVGQSVTGRSRSRGRQERDSMPEKIRRRQEPQGTHGSPHSFYRYVPAPNSRLYPEEVNRSYDRPSPVQHMEEDIYEPARSSQEPRRYEGTAPRSTMANKENSFESSSSRSQRSAQRRRYERSHPNDGIVPPWEAPHPIHQRSGDNTMFAAEEYVYSPGIPSNVEGGRREDEHNDGVDLRPRRRTESFPAEYYAHYEGDWAGDDLFQAMEEPMQRGPSQQRTSYRWDRQRDSELGDFEAGAEYARSYMSPFDRLPRVPTPPSSLYDSWSEQSPYTISFDDDEAARRMSEVRKGKAVQRDFPPNSRQNRSRSRSNNHRSPFVREATDGGTEKAHAPSIHSVESDPFYCDIDTLINGLDKIENLVEAGAKHVSFRSKDSVEEVAEAWTEGEGRIVKGRGHWDTGGWS